MRDISVGSLFASFPRRREVPGDGFDGGLLLLPQLAHVRRRAARVSASRKGISRYGWRGAGTPHGESSFPGSRVLSGTRLVRLVTGMVAFRPLVYRPFARPG